MLPVSRSPPLRSSCLGSYWSCLWKCRGRLHKKAEHARRWTAAGATHLSLNTMHAGLADTGAHIGALEEMAEVLL